MTTDLLRDLIDAAHEEGMTYAVWTEHGDEYRSEHEAAERATATAQTTLETAKASRTCANCKHWEAVKGKTRGGCEELFNLLEVSLTPGDYCEMVELDCIYPPNDFGCNRFESKGKDES